MVIYITNFVEEKQIMNPVARKSNLVVQDLNNETLVYDLNTNKALCLNETSSAIWNYCDGQKNSREIASLVSKQLKTSVDEAFVWLAIEELRKNDLLENASELKTGFDGMNRREMIRKVGLASVVALPIITSIVAPQAVNAASACGPVSYTNPCNNDSECATCNCVSPAPNSGRCCNPGAVNTFQGGTTLSCAPNNGSCNFTPCCSNSGTAGADNSCPTATGQKTCTCNP